VTDGPYTEAEVDAAIQRLSEPERLHAAQNTVGTAAPALQGILNQALQDGGFFDQAQQDEIRKALASEDPDAAVRTLLAEETRVVMLIGVAVGLELAHLLEDQRKA
jgi:hypothetical protein